MKHSIVLFLLVVCLGLRLNAQERRIFENGKSYLIHIVQKGETIFSLSKTYNLDKKKLLNANPDLIFGLKKGQELRIPIEKAEIRKSLTEPQQEDSPKLHSYRVKRRDRLELIAKRYQVEIEDILKYNPTLTKKRLKKRLKKGSILLIPDAADLKRIREEQRKVTPTLEDEKQNTSEIKTHRVNEHETLYSIAKKYNSSISAILEANPAAKKGLSVGMILTIPPENRQTKEQDIKKEGFFIHLVETGETFWSLERRYNVSQDLLEKYNPALANGLQAGLRIQIPLT